jgi:hypothetical protein
MAIPFKSLRYAEGTVWGINFRRMVKWKNELSFFAAIPAAFGNQGIYRMSLAATLTGLDPPRQTINLDIKPYAISSLTDGTTGTLGGRDLTWNVGGDLKYGPTRSLVADVTFNTDFSQVEEDLQQINLTRFSLFFPEKREFFLEGQGLYAFGGAGGGSSASDVPILFFSRRIGLADGQVVPVVAGGRLTGKIGSYGVGILDIATAEEASLGAAATNFSVVRVKRDVLRRSSVGAIFTGRTPSANISQAGGGSNTAYGVDANFALFRYVTTTAYYARTTDGSGGNAASSYRVRYEYGADRYGLTAERLSVDKNFNPEVGFARRTDFAKTFLQGRFSPRPRNNDYIRKLSWQGGINYITDAAGATRQDRDVVGEFELDFQNSDRVTLGYNHQDELVPNAFGITEAVVVPIGEYVNDTARLSYQLGQQRRVSGTISAARGAFYRGSRTEAGYSGRFVVNPHLAAEPNISLNWISIQNTAFTAHLAGVRLIVAPSPRMLISALAQFNDSASSLTSSVRLRWEYQSGSELFVVFSDGRRTDTREPLTGRSMVVKVTRLVRF